MPRKPGARLSRVGTSAFIAAMLLLFALLLGAALGETTQRVKFIGADLTDEERAQNRDRIFEYLTQELGYNTAAACGVLSNIYYESRFDPTALGDYGTSYGICQWHNKRFDRLLSWCEENELDASDLESQLLYMTYELSNNYSYVNERMTKMISNSSSGAFSAGNYWCVQYERPVDKEVKGVIRGDAARHSYWPIYN